MKVTPVSSPAAVTQAPAADNRAKAIAAFNNNGKVETKAAPTTGQAQETAVQNPNAVSVEELSAIKAPTAQAEAPETTDNTVSTEVAQPESKAETPNKASAEWAKLARQERQLRSRAQEQEARFKQREAAITAREAEAQAKSEINQKGYVSIESLRADPLGKLQEAGIPYDQIADQLINPSKIDPRLQLTIDSLKAEIADLKKGSTEANERMTQQQQAQYNAAVKQIDQDIKSLVSSDPNFETIRSTRSEKDVRELITATFEKDGVLMTVEDAANEVENYLVDEAMKLTRIEKIKRRLQPAATAGQKTNAQVATNGQTQAGMKTLTNAASSTRKLGARERAMLAFKGELK